MNLSFVAPIVQNGETIVELAKNEVEKETEKWRNALILYVVGNTPTIGALERFIVSQWNFVAKPMIFYHNEGYFVIKFNNMEDRDAILYSRPHTIGNKPIITKIWTPEFNFKDEILKTILLWVTLPNLPSNCWSADSLSRIGSGLEVPLYDDECTTKTERISYAIILIEMDVTVPLP
ncbi:uncharacterized protein [Nicotiana sylvestris]|uniref:Uncharacterized protein LOC104244604 n=1 Tax=Nicotiana sylvestris TaxID=4096 RepID=A0A1U7Y5F2_NICSY|nr:PREDICTED: uncharacterized protein LOC104244604 [Nicotiana sylvestris]